MSSSLSTLATFSVVFPFSISKVQCSFSALEAELVSLLNTLFHRRKKYHLSIYESLLSLLFTFPSFCVPSTYILLHYFWPNMRQPSWNPGSVAIIMIISLCYFYEIKSHRFRAHFRLHFLQTARHQMLPPLSPTPGHFSPTYYFLLCCFCDSIVEIFHDSKELCCSPDTKMCPRMIGVLLHPLRGERRG